MTPTAGRVLAVAHKGGNSPTALRAAAAAQVDVVELDVQPGRLEVRHARDLKPLPLLFDRGRLLPGWRTRLLLDAILDEADRLLPPSTAVMIDLKGTSTALGQQVAGVLRERGGGRAYLVCGRHWPALEAFADLTEVKVLLSAGSPAELATLQRHVDRGDRPGGHPVHGASLRHTLVTPAVVRALQDPLPLVLAWTVNRASDLERVVAAGVGGVISDRTEVLRGLVDAR